MIVVLWIAVGVIVHAAGVAWGVLIGGTAPREGVPSGVRAVMSKRAGRIVAGHLMLTLGVLALLGIVALIIALTNP